MAVSKRQSIDITESAGTPMETLLWGRKVGVRRWVLYLTTAITVGLSLFHLYTGAFSSIDPLQQRVLTLGLIMLGTYLLYPLGRKHWSDPLNAYFLVDGIFILGTIWVTFYGLSAGTFLQTSELSTLDWIAGTFTVIAVLETSRRTVGWEVAILAPILFLVNYLGPWMPGGLYARSFPWEKQLAAIYLGSSGLFGSIMGIVTDYLVLFFLFGGILRATGATDRFEALAFAIAGRFSGGPAKAAVFASALFGTINGSANSNIVVTGSFTIPLMKKLGYKPEWAAAIEAVASHGGGLTPPIMAASIFLMVDFIGVPYGAIALAAAIPAFLYYVGLFTQVHFEAKRLGLKGMPREDIPRLGPALLGIWPVAAGVAVLVFLLFRGYGMAYVIFLTVVTMLVISLFNKQVRQDPSRFVLAFEEGGRASISIGPVMACSAIILAAAVYSGLPNWFATSLASLSGGSVVVALFITAVIASVLGTALPGILCYVVVYVTIIPALVKMGVPELPAHLFAYYWAILASLTPPSAPTAFTAAALAKARPMVTGFLSMQLGLAGYAVPFAFALSPALILMGTPFEIVKAFVMALIAVVTMGMGFVGYKANWIQRVCLVGGGATFLIPDLAANLVGGGLFLVCLALYSPRVLRSAVLNRGGP
ncbi:MAG: TRAP transporter fused permease subunit [Chloroflexi bacterium]|nr:TRAP transporter fused permease subunit [Chloroflexota bacterium]